MTSAADLGRTPIRASREGTVLVEHVQPRRPSLTGDASRCRARRARAPRDADGRRAVRQSRVVSHAAADARDLRGGARKECLNLLNTD